MLDVASNRKILQALLTSIGVKEVDTAGNGQEAVQAALAPPQKYDLILMDNIMPIMVPLTCMFDCSIPLCDCYIHTYMATGRADWRRCAGCEKRGMRSWWWG